MLLIVPYEFATPEYDEAVRLRDEILRKPLGRSITDDDLSAEIDQFHFGLYDAGRLLGTATLRPDGSGGFQMRQVAVLARAQGQSVGLALVRHGEAFAKTRNATELFCHAREVARGFYERCGWEAYGEPYEEVGIPHVNMRSPRVGEGFAAG